MPTVFISGSRSVSMLDNNVIARLGNILRNQFDIVVGDANGADCLVQRFLRSAHYDKVKVYSSATPRNNIGNWESVIVPGFAPNVHTAKDIEMTNVADYGFVIWDGYSKGSERNIFRLRQQGKRVLVYNTKTKEFTTNGI